MAFLREWVRPSDPGKSIEPPALDARQLVLRTPGMMTETDNYFISNAFPNAAKIPVNSANFNAEIQSAIGKQVNEAGGGKPATLKQIVIQTHGESGSFLPAGPDDRHPVSIESTLDAIQKLQNKIRHQPGADPNFRVTDRLVIMGCDGFASLTDEQIKRYSEKAKKLGIDVVGSTDEVMYGAGGHMEGRFVKFGKDGSISRDNYDAGNTLSADKQEALKDSPEPYPGGGEWVGCYAGKDLKTGAACRDAPATLSRMFSQVGTSALEHGTSEQRKLAADMKTIEREYDSGKYTEPGDAERGKEIRKLAEDTGKKLADYLKGHPDPKLIRHLQHDLKISPADAAAQIEQQVNVSRLDRLSQASGVTNANTAGISAGALPDRTPTSATIYAGGAVPQSKSNQLG